MHIVTVDRNSIFKNVEKTILKGFEVMKRKISVFMALVLMLSIIFSVNVFALEKSSVKEGTYFIQSKLGNKMVLDIDDASNKSKANVQLWKFNASYAQRFEIKKSGSYYTISPLCSNLKLDVQSGSTESGANVWQYESNNSDSQKWMFYDAGDGYYYIRCKIGDKALDVKGGESATGTNIQMYTLNKSDAQKFKLVPTEVYSKYTGVNYRNLTSNKKRLKALDKAKDMVTISWYAPCDFVTWVGSSGGYNHTVSIDGTESNKFIAGKAYTGIPYCMNNRTYDDDKWIKLIDNGITTNGMRSVYYKGKNAGTKYGIDCSAFVCAAYKAAIDKDLSLNTSGMLKSSYFKKLSDFSKLKPGDVFLKNGHVMMFVGKSGSKYAVFESTYKSSKTQYTTYTKSELKGYNAYKFTGFGD